MFRVLCIYTFADNMSSNEALHHFTTTSGNFGWLQGDIFCQTDVLLSLGNDTYMTAALNPLSSFWKAKILLWRIFYLIKNSPIVPYLENMKSWYRFDARKQWKLFLTKVSYPIRNFDRNSSRILEKNYKKMCCHKES